MPIDPQTTSVSQLRGLLLEFSGFSHGLQRLLEDPAQKHRIDDARKAELATVVKDVAEAAKMIAQLPTAFNKAATPENTAPDNDIVEVSVTPASLKLFEQSVTLLEKSLQQSQPFVQLKQLQDMYAAAAGVVGGDNAARRDVLQAAGAKLLLGFIPK